MQVGCGTHTLTTRKPASATSSTALVLPPAWASVHDLGCRQVSTAPAPRKCVQPIRRLDSTLPEPAPSQDTNTRRYPATTASRQVVRRHTRPCTADTLRRVSHFQHR